MAYVETDPPPIKGSDMHPGTLSNVRVAQTDVEATQEIYTEANNNVNIGLAIIREHGEVVPEEPQIPAADATERRGRLTPTVPMVTLITPPVPFSDGKPPIIREMFFRVTVPRDADGAPNLTDPASGIMEVFTTVTARNAPSHLPAHEKARTVKDASLAGVEWTTQPRKDGQGEQRIAKPSGGSLRLNSRDSMSGMNKTLNQMNSWLTAAKAARAARR